MLVAKLIFKENLSNSNPFKEFGNYASIYKDASGLYYIYKGDNRKALWATLCTYKYCIKTLERDGMEIKKEIIYPRIEKDKENTLEPIYNIKVKSLPTSFTVNSKNIEATVYRDAIDVNTYGLSIDPEEVDELIEILRHSKMKHKTILDNLEVLEDFGGDK